MIREGGWAGLAGAIALAAVVACRATPEVTSASARPGLPVVALPDVSKAAESVQRQIRERHSALTTVSGNPAATHGDLGQAYGELGKVLMAAQYSDAAEASFRGAQTLNPDDHRWPYYLAHLYRLRGDAPQALALFERSSQLRPDDVATRVWVGETQLQLGRPEAAEPQFAKALELQPTSVSARFGLGRAALAKGDHRGAVAQLEAVLERDPGAAGAHYPLSLAYAALGDSSKAAAHLRLRANHEILPADPLLVELDALLDSPQTYESSGIRALEEKNWPEAADQFRKGLALAPNSAALHHRLGTALGMLGDRTAARREFEAAVGLAPDYFLAQYSLGLLSQEEGRHADAIRRFQAALEARPIYTPARLRLASSLRRTERAPEALAEYQRALAGATDVPEARLGEAMTLVHLGRHREARDRFDAAARATDAPMFKHALARLLATSSDDHVRDGSRAMMLAQELVAQGRTLDLGETTAMALAELGQFDQAVQVQRDLIAAAEKAGLGAIGPRLKANLARYERREPCRTPWTVDEVP